MLKKCALPFIAVHLQESQVIYLSKQNGTRNKHTCKLHLVVYTAAYGCLACILFERI